MKEKELPLEEMTLTDFFAGMAMLGYLSNSGKAPFSPKRSELAEVPRAAYDWADSMLDWRRMRAAAPSGKENMEDTKK